MPRLTLGQVWCGTKLAADLSRPEIPPMYRMRPEWDVVGVPESAKRDEGTQLSPVRVADIELPAMVAERAMTMREGIPAPSGWVYDAMKKYGPTGLADVRRFTNEWYGDTPLSRLRDLYLADKTFNARINTYMEEKPEPKLFDRVPLSVLFDSSRRLSLDAVKTVAPRAAFIGMDGPKNTGTVELTLPDGSLAALLAISDQYKPKASSVRYAPFDTAPAGTTVPARLAMHELVHYYQVLRGLVTVK